MILSIFVNDSHSDQVRLRVRLNGEVIVRGQGFPPDFRSRKN